MPSMVERRIIAESAVAGLPCRRGAGSAVRGALREAGLTSFTQEMLSSGYKEMSFPKEAAEAGRMARHGLHIWPRGTHCDGVGQGNKIVDTR